MNKFIVIILLLLLSSCVKVSMSIHEIEKQFNDNPKISNNAISPDNRFHLFVLEDGTVYAFGNKVNSDFRHGIPQLKEKIEEGRISIILWGFSTLL